jgi:hypothetical protein
MQPLAVTNNAKRLALGILGNNETMPRQASLHQMQYGLLLTGLNEQDVFGGQSPPYCRRLC